MMVRKSKGLGERHQKILAFIQDYQRKHQASPINPRDRRELRHFIHIGRELLS